MTESYSRPFRPDADATAGGSVAALRGTVAARAALSLLGAFSVSAVALVLVEPSLDATGDIVGYPVFFNYDPLVLIAQYWIVVALFPLVGMALYEVLARRAAKSSYAPGSASGSRVVAPSPAEQASPAVAGLTLRSLFVGAVLAFGLTLHVAGSRPLVTWAALTLVYFSCVLGVAWVQCRGQRGSALLDRWARANAIGALSTGAVPWVLSMGTAVVVPSGPEPQSWLSGSVALGLIALAVLWVLVEIRRGRRWVEIERRAAALIAAPVAVFALHSCLPRPLAHFDLFHAGESLAAGALLSKGYFPWRDLQFIHGLLEDPWKSQIGFALFGESVWGLEAGQRAVLVPLTFVSGYLLSWQLFRANRWVAILIGVLLPLVLPPNPNHMLRYFLVPWLALALLNTLRTRRAGWAAVVGGLALFQSIVAPECAVAVPGVALSLVLFEVSRRDPGQAFGRAHRLSLVAGGAACALAVGFALLLLHERALSGFVHYFQVVTEGHWLKGSHPLQAELTVGFRVRMVAPVLAFLSLSWWFFLAWRRRRQLSAEDYCALSLLLFAVPYYQKFLFRPDEAHLEMAFRVATPVIGYALLQMLALGDAWTSRRRQAAWVARSPRLASGALIVFVGMGAAPSVLRIIDDLPRRFRPKAPTSAVSRLGYVDDAPAWLSQLRRLDGVLGGSVSEQERVFDFANEPALTFFLLGRKPASPFFHVSMAISRSAQDSVIADLRRSSPSVALYYSESQMWSWDGIPNAVRHAEISEYLLRNYLPAAMLDGRLFLQRKGVAAPASPLSHSREHGVTTAVYRTLPACDWGFVPHFDRFASATDVVSSAALSASPDGSRTSIDLAAGWQEAGYLEIELVDSSVDELTLRDRGANPGSGIVFRTMGDGSVSYRIHVAACPQWFDWTGQLELTSRSRHSVRAVRLRRSRQEPGRP